MFPWFFLENLIQEKTKKKKIRNGRKSCWNQLELKILSIGNNKKKKDEREIYFLGGTIPFCESTFLVEDEEILKEKKEKKRECIAVAIHGSGEVDVWALGNNRFKLTRLLSRFVQLATLVWAQIAPITARSLSVCYKDPSGGGKSKNGLRP